ncbi:MAG: aspartate-semialdehyde dehydrogenase [Candidatus Omnitrophota bacterium]|nr:MAG: aspartate-semialdehyde dehydrogenase [Candidatus Omnitrophota bacterium]
MKKYSVAVVGVGAVGCEMLRVLRQRKFPIKNLRVFARSSRNITVDGITYHVKQISPGGFRGIDIALFAGTEGEKGAAVTYANEAIIRGAIVIDNGADFRMNKDVPLVVPEINPKDIKKHKGVIANPNCSTIQMVVALWPIYKKAGIKRIIISSYQAASGAGRGAVRQLIDELRFLSKSNYQDLKIKQKYQKALPQQLAFNVFPQIGVFGELDYTSEEWKTVRETHKIMHDDKIKISATTVRVPIRTGHGEAIYIETAKRITPDAVREIFEKAPGIKVIDNPKESSYPAPIDAEGKDEVFVGRIRKDPFVKNGLWMWVVSDNLRKGAALNAIQIAELLIKK